VDKEEEQQGGVIKDKAVLKVESEEVITEE
jgi:hypothetical protein